MKTFLILTSVSSLAVGITFSETLASTIFILADRLPVVAGNENS